MLVLFIRTLFKGNLNQPTQPAQLTSEGAKSGKPDFLPHTPPDKIFKNQSAGKSAPRSSADEPTNAAPTRKPTDERRFHPAIQMVKEITSRFPTKDIWDDLIEKLGDEPDVEFFRKSFVRWRSFKGDPQNFDKWIFEPNETKQIPQRFTYGNGNSSGKPPDVPKHEPGSGGNLSDELRRAALLDLSEIRAMGGEIDHWENYYTPEDWAWLMENLEK